MTGTCSWCGGDLAGHSEADNDRCRTALAEQLEAVFFAA